MRDIRIEQFEGPLDLLLQLIEKEQLDITEISLARITDEYLVQLKEYSEDKGIEELADFLVVASKLLLIKSRSILPRITSEEEEEISDFTTNLALYKEYRDASRLLDGLFRAHAVSFPRPFRRPDEVAIFSPVPTLSKELLERSMRGVHVRLERVARTMISISFDERITIQHKIEAITGLLQERLSLYFTHIISHASSKTDIIVSFLALLELVKQRTIDVSQEALFADMRVSIRSNG